MNVFRPMYGNMLLLSDLVEGYITRNSYSRRKAFYSLMISKMFKIIKTIHMKKFGNAITSVSTECPLSHK